MDAFMVSDEPENSTNRETIVALAAKGRIPAIYPVREFVEEAFNHVGLDWQKFVVVDPAFIRPAEVDLLVGNPAKAKATFGWKPEVDFRGLVRMMVDADLQRLTKT